MSRSTLAETFHRVVGETPGAYLQAWRLQLARAGLGEGRSFKRVARDVGYASHAALSRALSRRGDGGSTLHPDRSRGASPWGRRGMGPFLLAESSRL